MLWWTLGIALLLVVAAAFVLQRLYLRPWRELEHLLTRIGRGEQPPTFLLGGITRARRVGLALERLLARQRELDRQVSKDAAEVRAVLAALTDGLLVVDSSQHILICNPAFEQLYGQSRIATGTALLDIIRDSDVIEPIRAALDQARARVAEVTRARSQKATPAHRRSDHAKRRSQRRCRRVSRHLATKTGRRDPAGFRC